MVFYNMKLILTLSLTSVLLAGCVESPPQPVSGGGEATQGAIADGGGSAATASGVAADTGTDSGASSGGGSAATGASTGGSGADVGASSGSSGSGAGDSSASDTSGGSAGAATVKFSGQDFGYPRINVHYYLGEDFEHLTIDPREAYTVWALNYVEAQSLLEAMHAINAYREEHQQIKIINGGAEDLDSLVADYCPTSGAFFAADRCQYYARLAHSKTMNQDGWQIEHRENNSVPLMFGSAVGIKFVDGLYSLLGQSGRTTSYDGFDLVSTGVSPIEGWQYELQADQIITINRAVQNYTRCERYGEENVENAIVFRNRAALSPWPLDEPEYLGKLSTNGTLTVWLMTDDVVEDVYEEVTAEHDRSNLCKAAFQLDLKDVRPKADLG